MGLVFFALALWREPKRLILNMIMVTVVAWGLLIASTLVGLVISVSDGLVQAFGGSVSAERLDASIVPPDVTASIALGTTAILWILVIMYLALDSRERKVGS